VTLYQLTPLMQNALRPFTGRLAGMRVRANQVTVAAALVCIAHGALLATFDEAYRPLMLAMPLTLALRAGLTIVDGLLASEHGQKTATGAFLNELGDVVSDCGLYLPMAAVPGVHPLLVFGVVLAGVVAELTGVVAQQVGAGRSRAGPFGKLDRSLFFGVVAVLLGAGVPGGAWLDTLLVLALALALATVVNRARVAVSRTLE